MINFLLVLLGASSLKEGNTPVQNAFGSTLLAVGLNRALNDVAKE